MYYNPSFDEYLNRQKPQDEDPHGCIWQLLILLLIFLMLWAVYLS